ncbi:MAG TPA: bifunctional adenosylcobinamide kinase/adenosylcobinamide-phosphate guanylyltransferase [Acidimicrobiales bacterium]|nr:bifunctional adenosylcobinamide kinase/adenosylcobinamide-phosphate guanylyltransferase [Acidimicrobiales bacterium]
MWVLLGGARSGKSSLALRIAGATETPVTFLATGEALDEEMAMRIAAHRAERPATWSTVEVPIELEAALSAPGEADTLIVDCLTLWVSNLLGSGAGDEDVLRRAERAALIAADRSGHTIVVSNEVGWGIVPDNPLARRFRDILGRVNATFVRAAERSFLVVAGGAVDLLGPDDLVSALEAPASRIRS